jgi:hypothetical protein
MGNGVMGKEEPLNSCALIMLVYKLYEIKKNEFVPAINGISSTPNVMKLW